MSKKITSMGYGDQVQVRTPWGLVVIDTSPDTDKPRIEVTVYRRGAGYSNDLTWKHQHQEYVEKLTCDGDPERVMSAPRITEPQLTKEANLCQSTNGPDN